MTLGSDPFSPAGDSRCGSAPPAPRRGRTPCAVTAAELDIDLVLDSSGWVISDEAGGGLRGWHGGPVYWLEDLTHDTAQPSVTSLIDLAVSRGRSAGKVRVCGSEATAARQFQLLLTRIDDPSPARPRTAGAALVRAQGWDITSVFSADHQRGAEERPDSLTDLESRSAFTIRLDDVLAREHGNGHAVALLLAEIGVLGRADETVSRDLGERSRRAVAERLRAVLRQGDVFGLVAPDVYGVICRCVCDWPTLSPVLDRLRAVAVQPIQVSGQDVQITVSVSAIFADEVAHGRPTAVALLAAADRLMPGMKLAERV
jgi:GGDEF domain-containing protein